ncbi:MULTISPECIES: aldo/keto reductase [unclassified Streptomyces]|uniref:aldo/keto reductase n=1 Tax=unclassified Streptomyces TaxID=2593676 RepID=UPI0007DE2748|nr:aldo/keto reductase [Streptomyces sp. SAT1]ANH91043.1 oxidoreductase [Streptomyces sp. SAT1]
MTITEVFRIGGDVEVRRIGFGAMRLADTELERSRAAAPVWRGPADRAAALEVLRTAAESGVDLFDTADAYALGANEELLAQALHPYRDGVALATKTGVLRPSAAEWIPHGHPAYLRQQAELSLRRLRTDRIDLLQLHRIDPGYPLADQIGALRQLQEEGKVRHIGLSEVTVAQLTAASAIAPIASVQNMYNLAERGHDPVVDHTARLGIAFLPYFPVARGAHAADGGALAAVADELGATRAQVALAWLLHRSPNVIPIPGTSSAAHAAENAGALRLSLTEEQVRRIGAGVPV